MSLEKLVERAIQEVDTYAKDVTVYCLDNGLDEDGLNRMVMARPGAILEEGHPLRRSFLHFGFTAEVHPYGGGVHVAYRLSEMLRQGMDHMRGTDGESVNGKDVARIIDQKLTAGGSRYVIRPWGFSSVQSYEGTAYETSGGSYILERRTDPHHPGDFSLMKKVPLPAIPDS